MQKLLHKGLLLFILSTPFFVSAQLRTNSILLRQIQSDTRQKEINNYEKAIRLAEEKGWQKRFELPNGGAAVLIGVDVFGAPIYVGTTNNIRAAATIKTTSLWPGGSTGLNLTGSSDNLKGKLAVWDEGRVRTSHVELANRITQKDNPANFGDHSTHVSGTMIGLGINPLARGMAYGAKELIAYDFGSHVSEMVTEAPNLLVSNHSYGTVSGWLYNSSQARWEWNGEAEATEDFKFGFYNEEAQMWDSIAYNAPFYLIVKSAGNNRSSNGPAVGSETYWRRNNLNQLFNAGIRPSGISNNDGYDIVATYGTAKNVLTIGAVAPLANGYNRAEDVSLSNFSSWGPTDDGRIKPDVVANGVNLVSSISTSDNDYANYSGTSMAAPNASGSILLLQEYWSKLNNGTFMRAATLKGILIHTADEAGPDQGPDYKNGWGLLNMEKAAAVIKTPNTEHLVRENNLVTGGTFSIPVVASGKGQLKVTISWTDPKAAVDNINKLNNPTPKLVNDLDIRIRKGSTVYQPYTLEPANPSASARGGDNILDNVEQIVVDNVIPGESYTIVVSHKGTLDRGQQAYSLIASGIGGQAYCTSGPTTNTGARIDSVSIGNFKNVSNTGCTTYSNFTNLTADIEANQQVPLTVKVSSCDASSVSKIVKVFVDWNNDGDFTDANETIGQSGPIVGNGVFTTPVTSPVGLPVGNYTIMRVIVQEAAAASEVSACGTFAKGETQDYRLRIMSPSNDLGVTNVLSPDGTECAGADKYVSVSIKNYGPNPQVNIPITAVVKNGATVIATLNAVYPDPILPFSEVIYTFQTPLTLVAGTTLTISASTTLTTDQAPGNNVLESTVVVTSASAPTATVAELCTPGQAMLKAAPSPNDIHFWFDSPTAHKPIVAGDNATVTSVPTNKTFYVQKNGTFKAGPATKMVLGAGGYNAFSGNFVKFTNDVPVTLETVRLYIGNPGKINFIVADIISFDQTTGSYSYRPIASTTIDVYATDPTPQAGMSEGNDALDTGAVYTLNLPVTTTGEHAIIVQCQNGATIFRNNGIPNNPYPFSIPNVLSITGNSALLATDPLYFQKFYYFLYDMQVSTNGCPSARVPVVAAEPTAPVVTQAGNVLTSNVAIGIQWYKNGAAIPNANAATYTATEQGLYKVVTISPLGCFVSSNEINYVVTSIVNVNPGEIKLKASPNPSKGQFSLEFEMKGKENLSITIVNTLGQLVYNSNTPNFTGRFSKQINAGNLTSGLYSLRIQHGKKAYVKKLIIE